MLLQSCKGEKLDHKYSELQFLLTYMPGTFILQWNFLRKDNLGPQVGFPPKEVDFLVPKIHDYNRD